MSTLQPGQEQPSAQDIMKSLRNTVTLAQSDATEKIFEVLNVYQKQITIAAKQIVGGADEIGRLQNILKEHKIDFSPPPVPKAPNRAQKRAAAKAEKRAKKKSTKKE